MRETTEQLEETPRGFPYPDLSGAPAEVRQKFESLPAKINLFRMLAHSHGLYVPLMEFTQAVFKKLELSKRHYELAVLLTGRRTRSEYEWRQHLGTSAKAGVPAEQVAAIEQDRIDDAKVFDDEERLVLRMTAELLQSTEVTERTLAEARHRFTEGQIVELIIVVGFYQALAGLIRSVDLDYNPEAAKALVQGM